MGLTGGKPLKLPGVKEASRRDKSTEEEEAEVAAVYMSNLDKENGDFDNGDGGAVDGIIFTESESERAEKLEAEGWIEMGPMKWRKRFPDAGKLPMPDVGGVKRRIVRDSVNGVLIDDFRSRYQHKPERIERAMKRRRDIQVEVERHAVDEKPTLPWEEKEMTASEATQYRAVVARCNFLSVDRPDIQFASKECSRCMSSPKNGDWEALKRLGRYLLSRPRVVHLYKR